MTLPTIIQDRTNDGITIVDFLFAVMRNELAGFKPCHRLDAAKLLVKYERDEALNFTLDYIAEPSRSRPDSDSSDDSYFDEKLAQVIRESTDDGRSVCRFLINVMDGELKAFKPHHRISAARELLSRGFGKHPTSRRSGGGRNPEEPGTGVAHPSIPNTQTPKSQKSPNHTNQSSDNSPSISIECDCSPIPWDKINPILEEAERISAEQEPDPDNPPYTPDYSVFDEAAENSHRWFHEWKNSIDPREYQAIINETSERFSARLDARIERRKQIKKDRERREKEEAEREAQQAKARAKAKAKAEAEAKEEEDIGPPPSEEEHELVSATPNIPSSYVYRRCGHPKCKLHDKPRYFPEDDRNSPYYSSGRAPPMHGNYPL